MLFKNSYVKSIKADIAKGEITISFVITLSNESMQLAKELSAYVIEGAPDLQLSVNPRQISFKSFEITAPVTNNGE